VESNATHGEGSDERLLVFRRLCGVSEGELGHACGDWESPLGDQGLLLQALEGSRRCPPVSWGGLSGRRSVIQTVSAHHEL
jgi:hypothetical protein